VCLSYSQLQGIGAPSTFPATRIDGLERFGLYNEAVLQLLQEQNADRFRTSRLYRPRANRVINFTAL